MNIAVGVDGCVACEQPARVQMGGRRHEQRRLVDPRTVERTEELARSNRDLEAFASVVGQAKDALGKR